MLLSSTKKKKKHEVQSFMLKLINNNCPGVANAADGPRVESRVNLTIPVLVIPFEKKRPVVNRLFTVVTKEFTTTGVSLVLNEPRAIDEVILGVRFGDSLTFIRAAAAHLNPMGAGFFQLGLRLIEVVRPSDYPALAALNF